MYSSIIRLNKTYLCIFILLVNILSINYPLVAESQNNTDTEEKTKISQIMSYYKEGKEEMERENYLAAIVDFKHVIELEKDFHIIYTPYAQQFIQKAMDKIKEKEEKELASPTGEKKEKTITADTATITSEKSPVPASIIQKAPDKIKENEEKELINPAVSEKKEEIAADTATIVPEKVPVPEQTSIAPKTSDYIIGVDDILFISVWQNKDLDQELTVRPDGKISVLLIGDVQAEGLTIPQLDDQITTGLKDYIKFPEVSITLRKIGGKKIIILGEVNRPGVYAVAGKSTVLELIAMANGYTNNAVLDSVIVIRGGFQKPVGKRLNLVRAIKKADISQNIVLEPQDIVYVPKNFISNVNYFVSQILGPITQGLTPAEIVHHW